MPGQPVHRMKSAREQRVFDTPGALEDLCIAIESGPGMSAWCQAHECRYAQTLAWIEADPERESAVRAARRARAGLAADAIDAIGRRLVAPGLATGVEIVDDSPLGLDPKAARVALEAFKFGAAADDRLRFGRQVQHTHLHQMQADHLQALRSALGGGQRTQSRIAAPVAPAFAIVDVEFRDLGGTESDSRSARRTIRDAVRFSGASTECVNER